MTAAMDQERCVLPEWWGGGELLRSLANRTDDRLGAQSERQRKIKDVAKFLS